MIQQLMPRQWRRVLRPHFVGNWTFEGSFRFPCPCIRSQYYIIYLWSLSFSRHFISISYAFRLYIGYLSLQHNIQGLTWSLRSHIIPHFLAQHRLERRLQWRGRGLGPLRLQWCGRGLGPVRLQWRTRGLGPVRLQWRVRGLGSVRLQWRARGLGPVRRRRDPLGLGLVRVCMTNFSSLDLCLRRTGAGAVRCASDFAVSDELEGLPKLPLQVDRQSDRYLVAGVEIIG